MVAVLVLTATVVTAVLVAAIADGGDSAPQPLGTAPGSPSAPAAEASGRLLVDELERAWDSGSRRDFTALAATGSRARRATEATWQALTALDVGRLDLRWVSSAARPGAVSPGRAAAGRAVAVVEVMWERAGWSVAATNELELVHTVDDVGTESSTGQPVGSLLDLEARAGEPAPLWALAPLDVVTTRGGASVVGLAGRSLPGELLRLVAAADREVGAVLPDSGARTSLIVVAPGTATQFAELVADRSDYAAIAAVTTTADGSVRSQAPVQVLLNPPVFDRLGPVAAGVVLAHEATHVVTGATSVRLPLWVAEGFADFVALRDGAVPVRVAAARAITAARRDGVPRELPSAADFATDAHGLGRAYELAWLAFRALDQRVGTDATVDFYRAAVAGDAVGPALRATTGVGVGALTRSWRAELDRLVSVRS